MRLKIQFSTLYGSKENWNLVIITFLNAFTLKLITDIEEAIKKTLVLRFTVLY